MGIPLWEIHDVLSQILPEDRNKLARLDLVHRFILRGIKVGCTPRNIDIWVEQPQLTVRYQRDIGVRGRRTRTDNCSSPLTSSVSRNLRIPSDCACSSISVARISSTLQESGLRQRDQHSLEQNEWDTYLFSSAPRNSTAYLSSLHVSTSCSPSSMISGPSGGFAPSSRVTERILRVPRVESHVGDGQ